jgi:hypothetical protein
MITNIQLYAERHTGSKWLVELLEGCFGVKDVWSLGWKHWFPEWDKIEKINQDDYLFIVLSRDPYDWLTSMKRTPHHAHKSLKQLDWNEFLNKEWISVWEKRDVPWIPDKFEKTEMIHERNPDTGERFKNVIELRNYKNREFLSLKDKVKYVHYVRYEDMLKSAVGVINKIAREYPIRPIRPIRPEPHFNTKPHIPKEILEIINNNIDWELEEKLGYKKYRFNK